MKKILFFMPLVIILMIVQKGLPGSDKFDLLRYGFHIIFDVDNDIVVHDYIHTVSISIDDISKHLQDAVIAIEDRRFYYHPGIDPIGIGSTLWDLITEGTPPRGASTLTQQLAKNLLLNPQQTVIRKLKEALLSIKLEMHYRKDEILEMYLNQVYFGNRAYGVEAAARRYFGKRAAQLNLYEAAVLAATLKAPAKINLLESSQLTHQRAQLVLNQMLKLGFIDQDQLDQALRIGIQRGNKQFHDIDYQYFKDWITPTLKNYLGNHKGRVRVITTLSPELQIYGELAIRRTLDKASHNRVSQGALLAMSSDGAVRAMVGGIRYGIGPGRSTFNRTTQAKRQLGSVFKPIVYLVALQNGFTPSKQIMDAPFYQDKEIGNWPKNYHHQYHGLVTLEEALSKSLNGATVHLIQAIGIEKVIELARKLGIQSRLDNDLGIALGICEASLLEIVTVFSVFANHGSKTAPYGILGILDAQGKILYWRTPPQPEKLVNTAHIAALTRMLRSAIINGTGRQAAFGNHPSAGKTGTTQNYRDAWFIGYTHHLVTGAWVGNDDQTPMRSVTGSELPASIWRNFMANAHLGLSSEPLMEN